jgi:hypothetical protein
MTERVTLESSALEAVTYDEVNQTLDIEFREGRSYRYKHVPEGIYRGLLNAESAGAFGNAVKEGFEYVKLD